MQKYKRPKKYPHRSIPLRNPTVVRWPVDVGRPRPTVGPTVDCFTDDAAWYEFKGNSLVRATGEGTPKVHCVVLYRRRNDVEMRLYHFGNEYIFVQLYYCIRKIWISVKYRKDAAMLNYSKGTILWKESRPIAGES